MRKALLCLCLLALAGLPAACKTGAMPPDSSVMEQEAKDDATAEVPAETMKEADVSVPEVEAQVPGEIRLQHALNPHGNLNFAFVPGDEAEDAGDEGENWELRIRGESGFEQAIGLGRIAEEADPDLRLLVVEDMNGDGLDDFRVLADLPAGPNLPYHFFLYDAEAGQFARNDSLAAITSPQFIEGQVRSFWRESAGIWGNDTFVMIEDKPVLIRHETWDATDEDILETYGDGYARYQRIDYDPATGLETLNLDQAEMVE